MRHALRNSARSMRRQFGEVMLTDVQFSGEAEDFVRRPTSGDRRVDLYNKARPFILKLANISSPVAVEVTAFAVPKRWCRSAG